MPEPLDPESILARHEAGLFGEARMVLMGIDSGHRSEAFNRLVLPLCQPLVEAIGHRMAYEAAMKAKVDQDLIDMYVANVLKHDASWYIEFGGLSRRAIAEKEDRAASALLPRLESLLEETGVGPYCQAPIVSQKAWDAFVDTLPHHIGKAALDLIPGTELGRHLKSKL